MELRNIIRMGWGVFCAHAWDRKGPLNVMLSITNRCSCRCNYCNIFNRQTRELKTTEIFELIDQIRQLGCQRLGLWGGEPLLRDDIGEIINYAKKKKLFVTLDSNGYLLPQKIKLLKNLDQLILAFDGPKQMHDLNKEEGSFEKVMAAIEAAKGKIKFWTITVLTKNNLDSIDFILEKAREYNFLAAFQLLHHNDILSRNQSALLPPAQECREAIQKLILAKHKGQPIASSESYLRYILNWPDYKKVISPDSINGLKCWAGRLYCNVDTDGSLFPCSLLIGKGKALNFLEVGFKKAFNNLRHEFCNACMGGCFTEYNYLYSLHINTIIDWLNSMKRTKSFIVRRS